MKKKEINTLAIRLAGDNLKNIREIAKREMRSVQGQVSYFLNSAIENYIDRHTLVLTNMVKSGDKRPGYKPRPETDQERPPPPPLRSYPPVKVEIVKSKEVPQEPNYLHESLRKAREDAEREAKEKGEV